MKEKRIKKRMFTLMEMMIVMTIIAALIGVLAVKYAGSLDENRAFKTKAAIERLSGILNIKAANDPSFIDRAPTDWQNVVRNSPMVNDPNSLIYDGWGAPYTVTVEGGNIEIHSSNWDSYIRTHETNFGR